MFRICARSRSSIIIDDYWLFLNPLRTDYFYIVKILTQVDESDTKSERIQYGTHRNPPKFNKIR